MDVKKDSIDYSRKWVRFFLFLAGLFVIAFIFLDKQTIPEPIFNSYLVSRLLFQVLPIAIGIILTFKNDYRAIYQPALFIIATIISLSNIYVIWSLWDAAKFSFAYEGLMLYLYFYFFIARMDLKFAMIHTVIVNVSFSSLLLYAPIYGPDNILNAGFTLTAHLIGLVGVYKLQKVLIENYQYNKRLFRYSITDELTGVMNRKGYDERAALNFNLAKRNQQNVSLFVFDLDYFKEYNDNYGHSKGDAILQMQAKILNGVFLRESDLICRFGGDEFVVLTSNISLEDSHLLADKVLQYWQRLAIDEGKVASGKILSCSIGIYCREPEANDKLGDFFAAADKLLYQAKKRGKNRYVSN